MIAKHTAVVGAWIVAGLGFVGCNKSSDVPNAPAGATSEVSSDAHGHGEWWCDEHGVPEVVCAQCNTKLVADFKAKGDWCAEHGVPESQCLKCNPELKIVRPPKGS